MSCKITFELPGIPLADPGIDDRNREAVLYHDWFGPSVLCGVLLLAVIVNFVLRVRLG